MIFHLIKLVLLLTCLALPSLAFSNEGDKTDVAKQALEDLGKLFDVSGGESNSDKSKSPSTPTLPEVWCSAIEDDKTKNICWTAYQASLKYYETGLEHREKVFWWQHITTRVTFFVVLLLVGLGLYFAWTQFRIDIKANGKTDSDKEHSVEFSTSGVKVSSPVLGVIILALSLAFFYLYLVYVYPISEIF